MTTDLQTSAQPEDEPNRGGRPPFVPTAPIRRQVAVAAGGGMTHESIAAALGISPPTLRKHFAGELSEGASKRRLEVMDALFRAAKKGSVSAAKAYLAAGDPLNAAPPPVPAEPKQPKPGKKQQANEDAKTAQAGTDWGELLPGAPLQ